jgi:N-acyl-phosphatidylethanolamine-hydrolysing phospholipase D
MLSRTDGRGRFVQPWLLSPPGRGLRQLLRWQAERLRHGTAPAPPPGSLRPARPALAHPRAAAGELRITWVGHATFLVQIGGINLLTDPIWSRRASPLRWLGPARMTPPGLELGTLPPIDVVLVSHDHYDHLDGQTVRHLNRRFSTLHWVTPLGYRSWLARRGARRIVELDWWQEARIATAAGSLAIRAAPAQHWSKRSPFSERTRLWASYAFAAAERDTVFFCGDSGYFEGLRVIGELLGPFSATLLPIGAYEPRWFMGPAHMNPEEAVQAFCDLGGRGTFVGMHWGTFRLSDEPPLEPPARTRAAWAERGLPPADLWIPHHGETRVVRR